MGIVMIYNEMRILNILFNDYLSVATRFGNFKCTTSPAFA